MADQYTPTPVKTKTDGDVATKIFVTAGYGGHSATPLSIAVSNAIGQQTMAASLPVALASNQSAIPVSMSGTWTVGLTNDWSLVDNAGFTDGATRVGMAGYIFDETPGTALTENDAAAARIDSKRAQVLVIEDATTRGQRAAVDSSGRISVTGSGGTFPVTGTFWPTAAGSPGSIELSDGAAFYTAAKTGQFPSALVGGRLDTNIGAWLGSTAPTVGQKTMANSIPVVIASDQGSLSVSAGQPSSPQRDYITASALAISTRTAYNFTDLGAAGVTGKLANVVVSSSVAVKWELYTVSNGTEGAEPVAVFFTSPNTPTFSWIPPHMNYVTMASSAGADNFRIYATNLDQSLAADVYMTALWDQV